MPVLIRLTLAHSGAKVRHFLNKPITLPLVSDPNPTERCIKHFQRDKLSCLSCQHLLYSTSIYFVSKMLYWIHIATLKAIVLQFKFSCCYFRLEEWYVDHKACLVFPVIVVSLAKEIPSKYKSCLVFVLISWQPQWQYQEKRDLEQLH